ncbi:MAG: 4-hydroxy-3-methylbut-2-enyl diphosphate reductase [Helicobacteraceae bacterium]|jgi:4-hydroxy-3-methylbut-2-enyl diphosphate reductase|nr:4-hydroxy-3-methylbut-2-enyl diphosphate reductase [Helicobacteraceae bacterium]
MQVKLAEKRGFCFGVKRAIAIAEESGGAITFGEIIHNHRETKRLEAAFGVKIANNLAEIPHGAKVIIRTHGIEKHDRAALIKSAAKVIDATCPFVKKPQKIAEKMRSEGYQVIIFGDAKHPEVKGVLSYAGDRAIVIGGEEELARERIYSRAALISQTTKQIDAFYRITAALVARTNELRVFNTICNATFENQNATRRLADSVDIMIVVGGKNSSNTKQLHKIALDFCADSYLIEDAAELDSAIFAGKRLCGVTAGASTPDWIISEVVSKIENF